MIRQEVKKNDEEVFDYECCKCSKKGWVGTNKNSKNFKRKDRLVRTIDDKVYCLECFENFS